MSKLKDGDLVEYTDDHGKTHTGILQELSAQYFIADRATHGVEGAFVKNLTGVKPFSNKGVEK